MPVAWTTYLWRPEQLSRLIEAAGLEIIAEMRLPASGLPHPQVLFAAQR
jgi:hypothetical protein